jgi:type I restriction enzyme S subunit
MKRGKVRKNDVLLVKDGATIGKLTIIKEMPFKEMAVNEHVYIIRANNELDQNYLFYYLSLEESQQRIQSVQTGSAQPGINSSFVNYITILYPPLKEQQKIVTFISKMDELIEKTNQIIEKTQTLKKGLMRRLLTKGIGHTRFKLSELGEIPEEWKIVKVTDICQGIVPGRNKPRQFNGSIPWITIEDIDGIYVKESKRGLKLTKEEVRNCLGKIIPSNSVIMTCVGELGIVGIAANDIVMNQQLHAFVCSDKIIPYYLANFLKSQKNYMYSIATTTTIPYMNKNNCNSIPIALPSIKEQNKISEILKNLDLLIENKKSQKKALLNLKKSLMQQLLTGKIRVKI